MTTDTASATARELADQLVEVLFDHHPVIASMYGVHDRDSRLPDLSDAAERTFAERTREIAERARAAAERPDLTAVDRLTLGVVTWVAADMAADADARKPEWQITDLFVAPASGMLVFLPTLVLSEAAHAEAYVERLSGTDRYLTGVAERHRAGVAAGSTPVRRLVRAAIQQIDNYLAAPQDDPLTRPAPPDAWAGAERFRADLDRVLAEVVRPAFARYRDVLATEIEPHGRDDEHPGLSAIAGGADRYRALTRVHTTTERTAEELHRVGLDLVARLAEEYAELGGRVFGTTDPAEVMRRLREDTSIRFTSAEEMLDEARRAIERAEAAAPRWFGRVPGQRCQVKAVPASEEARAPGAYYEPPSLDGARPGTYWQNTRNPTEQPRHLAQFTAYHEAVPGHHFQSALAQEMRDVPTLRRFIGFTAYDEGWALYCERLADEMGLYTDDLARLGMLAGDSMRANRLVVDTGMHAMGWSRRQAVDYMLANTPVTRADIEVEVDRYIADPGQALAYMVGRLEIQRIRADAERRLGDRFDIRGFHDTVLGAGALPLTMLAAQVDAWVERQREGGG